MKWTRSFSRIPHQWIHRGHAPASQAAENKLLIRRDNIEIKVEVNFVLRGVVGTVTNRPLTRRAQEILQAAVDVPVNRSVA